MAFLDSDDYWYPEKLSAQVDFFKKPGRTDLPDRRNLDTRRETRQSKEKTQETLRHGVYSVFGPLPDQPVRGDDAKTLLSKVDAFDESLPACEDYDLWLRVACRYPVHLIDKPLLVKTGGHADQLSSTVGLDKYRIYALKKILQSGFLTPAQYQAAQDMLKKKCRIYADGCIKHGRKTVGNYYLRLAEEIENQKMKVDSEDDEEGPEESDV
ncbi:MAG: hypothetical protein R2861_11260 [Desulfobacterales bacterium]